MARSISEFIMEQETGIAPVSDNYVQAYCECAIATSMANSYLEQAQIALFATECETHVVQEQNIFSKIGTAVKTAWKNFWKWVRSLFKNVGHKVTEAKVADMIDALLGIPDDTTLENVDVRIANIGHFAAWLKDAVKEINDTDLTKINGDLINKFDNLTNQADNYATEGTIKAFGKKYTDSYAYLDTKGEAKTIKSITAGELKSIVASIETKNIKKTIDEADEHINKIEKNMVTVTDKGVGDLKNSDDTKMADLTATTEKRGIEAMRKLTQALTKGYDRALKDFKEAYDVTAPAIKAAANKKTDKATADEKKALGYKEESFYYV